jgi:hypothetical protein
MFNFISRFFARGKVKCPRCLGKGNVDLADIKRLKMELYWGEGQCAYCGGSGKVLPSTVTAIRPDMAYLTTDTPNSEKLRLLNRDENSLKRARDFEAETESIIKEIEDLYFIENLEPERIADSFEGKYQMTNYVGDQRKAMINYINKVIQRRLGSS